MKRNVVVANVLVGLATLAGLAGHARYQNRMALSHATGLCAATAFRSRLEHFFETVNASASAVPGRMSGNDLRYTFNGFGSYSASCVVTQSNGLVLTTSVIESR